MGCGMMRFDEPGHLSRFDLGAESGRAVVAELRSGALTIHEVHRFPNNPVMYGDSLHWDVARLWHEMRAALALVRGTQLAGIGVDTWGVDYALVGERLSCSKSVPLSRRAKRRRDGRRAPERAEGRDLRHDRHSVHGDQHAQSARRDAPATPRLLAAADRLLMMPDLFNYG